MVGFLLLGETLAQRLHELLPAPEALDHGLFFFGQIELFLLAQPVERNLAEDLVEEHFLAAEVLTEDLVEAIEIAFVLDQRRACKVVEVVDAIAGHARFQRGEQGQILGDRDRYLDLAQLVEEFS